MNCPIFEHAKCNPHSYALLTQDRAWTYHDLDMAIRNLCHSLKIIGVKENHRIAFIARPMPETIILFFALLRIRAIACPLTFRIPEEQLPKYYELLKPSHILKPETLPLSSRDTSSDTYIHAMDLDQLATFLFTSGSNGTPKIACHSIGNHYYNAIGVLDALQLDTSSCWLLSLPLFHISGLAILFRCFLKGASVVLTPCFDLEMISTFKISHISLVPTQLYRLLKEPPELIETMKHSLRCILLGGAPLPPSLLERTRPLSLPIFTTYGMTEMSSIITLSHLGAKKESEKNLPYRYLNIAQDQEIWVSGKTLFKGYWDTTHAAVVRADEEGWFPTKDLGRWSEDHQLELLGRKDRQFISGGENIQPEEIERTLCSLAGISQASILPITDAEFGQRPVAFIDSGADHYTVEEIREKLKGILPGFMHPVHIFPYPFPDANAKPNFSFLRQHLSQILKSRGENQE